MTLQRVITFHLPGQEEWVIDLELLSVRPKYRGYKVGKYLLNLSQNPRIVGTFDAVVTSSDSDAISFYEKYSFSVDPILNSRYSTVGDIWTNTTKMCYIPPYLAENGGGGGDSTSFIEELTKMERDYGKWQKLVFGAYQSQARLFMKLKQEVLSLKANLCAKDSVVDELRVRNEVLERENRLLRLKLREAEKKEEDDEDEEEKKLIAKLERLQT
jgi:hypothetical protein